MKAVFPLDRKLWFSEIKLGQVQVNMCDIEPSATFTPTCHSTVPLYLSPGGPKRNQSYSDTPPQDLAPAWPKACTALRDLIPCLWAAGTVKWGYRERKGQPPGYPLSSPLRSGAQEVGRVPPGTQQTLQGWALPATAWHGLPAFLGDVRTQTLCSPHHTFAKQCGLRAVPSWTPQEWDLCRWQTVGGGDRERHALGSSPS